VILQATFFSERANNSRIQS